MLEQGGGSLECLIISACEYDTITLRSPANYLIDTVIQRLPWWSELSIPAPLVS